VYRACYRWCKRHSLSITSFGVGVSLVLIGANFTSGEGMWWDIWSGAGLAFLIPSVWYLMAGRLREVNKPEEPPKTT
jgi:hypothetical protein